MRTQFGPIWEAIADAVPDQAAVVQGDRRVSWRDYEQRGGAAGPGAARRRARRRTKVGMYLYNSPEYCETNFAAIKIRGVPINVNYRYLDDELAYLLDNADVEALVFHTSLGRPGGAGAVRGCPKLRLLVEVDDGPAPDGTAHVDGAVRLRASCRPTLAPAARIAPEGDEIYMFYTGGTTGMPKGVMYPMGDFTEFFLRTYPPMIGLAPIEDAGELPGDGAQMLRAPARRWSAMSGPPLMHGTGCWLGMMVPHLFGGTAVLQEGRGLDAAELWNTVARERVSTSSSSATRSPSRCCAPSTTNPIAGTCRACA